jgi:MYXO-CTERM domain-containing protein
MLTASTTRSPFLRPLLGLALCGASLTPAQAELIQPVNVKTELVLLLLDQTKAEMTYIKDLGISAKDFWITGQQDAGASLFKTLDPDTDPALKTFLQNADLASTRWIVTGMYQAADKGLYDVYSTLTNNGSVATQRASFDLMKGIISEQFQGDKFTPIATYVQNVASFERPVDIFMTSMKSEENGSALASKNAGNIDTYAAVRTKFTAKNNPAAIGDCQVTGQLCMGNPLGTSSWFYRLNPRLDEDGYIEQDLPIVYDEFDNLDGDGYWGLIKDPESSKYVLSYNLAAATPRSLVSTDFGRSRLSFTDYSAQSGFARQILALAGDDVANAADAAGTFLNGGLAAQAVTAVPEPQSWGLMALGLLGLAAHARRRRSSNGA